jgi:hemin uptake protein HemP
VSINIIYVSDRRKGLYEYFLNFFTLISSCEKDHSMTDQLPLSTEREAAADNRQDAVREINSDEILRGTKTVVITHDGVQYRLHVTKNNKLILHK